MKSLISVAHEPVNFKLLKMFSLLIFPCPFPNNGNKTTFTVSQRREIWLKTRLLAFQITSSHILNLGCINSHSLCHSPIFRGSGKSGKNITDSFPDLFEYREVVI